LTTSARLFGPNGAGKTALLKMLTTLLYPTGGTILVDGLDVQEHGREMRARIGWVPANRRALSWKLTGEENLQFLGASWAISPPLAAGWSMFRGPRWSGSCFRRSRGARFRSSSSLS